MPRVKGARIRLGVKLDTVRAEFAGRFARVKQEIADGTTYQVNLTFPLTAAFDGDPLALFADIVDAQQGAYSAFLRVGDRAICSASPAPSATWPGGCSATSPT